EAEGLFGANSVADKSYGKEVATMLQQMNNASERGILVVMASNHPDQIDPRLLRTGRTDMHLMVDLPDLDAREELLNQYFSKATQKEAGLTFHYFAQETEGYSAADIKMLFEAAARLALSKGELIDLRHLEEVLKDVNPSLTEEEANRYRSAIEERVPPVAIGQKATGKATPGEG
ncbi:MAG: ATP-binding protein, partial [Vampirovibrionales bacterium]